jgi:hypothetical protein
MTPERRKQLGLASFWPTVFIIELTDIAFAVDSILAAIAMVGSKPAGLAAGAFHPKLWVVVLGGLIGLMLMRVAAKMFITLLDRFPRFEVSAYLLVIVIGLKLLADWGVNSDWSFEEPKWIANRLGGWQQTFHDLEVSRRELVHDYEGWLANRGRSAWPSTHQPSTHPQNLLPPRRSRPAAPRRRARSRSTTRAALARLPQSATAGVHSLLVRDGDLLWTRIHTQTELKPGSRSSRRHERLSCWHDADPSGRPPRPQECHGTRPATHESLLWLLPPAV